MWHMQDHRGLHAYKRVLLSQHEERIALVRQLRALHQDGLDLAIGRRHHWVLHL